MLRKLKNQKGFTLVEVIVVAVIVLILAAVAIPLYNGYIKDSRINVAENTAGSLASALAASVQQGTYDADIIDETEGAEITIPGLNETDNLFKVPQGFRIELVGSNAVKCIYVNDGDDVAGVESKEHKFNLDP